MLIVEDGTGIPEAESYASVEYADAYHARFGNEAWDDLVLSEKEVALRTATRNMNLIFTYKSTKLSEDQSNEWPRVDYTGVPKAIVDACVEMALITITVDVTGPSSGTGNIAEYSETTGPLSETTKYFAPREDQEEAATKRVQLIMKQYLAGGGSGSLFSNVVRG